MSQTKEQYIKLLAHDFLMRYKNLGLTWEKAQDAAHILILALCDQYLKVTKDTPKDTPQQKLEARQMFEALAKGLNDYRPGRDYVEVSIDEIAALKGCSKSQILITYKQ